jgi:rhodanese-related sulfurtransferase
MNINLPFFKSATPIEQLNAAAVHALWQQSPPDLVLLDVRQPEEWREGIIPGALKISLADLPHQLATLTRDKDYVLICRSGNRSSTAAQLMHKAGFTRLANFQGGMLAWYDQHYPLAREK